MNARRGPRVRSAMPVLMAVVLALVAISLASGHWDPPEPPELEIFTSLYSISLDNPAIEWDWYDGDAELMVLRIANQPLHQDAPQWRVGTEYKGDYVNEWTFSPSRLIYEHYECSPCDPLGLSFRVIEEDTDAWTVLGNAVVTLAAFGVAFASWPVGIALAALSSELFVINLHNTNNLGTGVTTVCPTGNWWMRTAGEQQGHSTVQIWGWNQLNSGGDTHCLGDTTGYPENLWLPTPVGRDTVWVCYDSWLQQLRDAAVITFEPGYPGDLAELQEDRETVSAFIWFCIDSLTSGAVESLLDPECDGCEDAYAEAYAALLMARVPCEACCFPDGSCEQLTAGQCVAMGGTPQGPGTSCDPNPCPGEPSTIYAQDFEGIVASPEGIPLPGQDQFYTPAGSVDWLAFTYPGNTVGLPPNPEGDNQFVAGTCPGGWMFARAQRDVDFGADAGVRRITYDLAATYLGSPPSANNIGSFSIRSSDTATDFVHLFAWVDPNVPTSFNAFYLAYDAVGTPFPQPGASPGPEWENLALNHWYRCWTVLDLDVNMIVEVGIRDLATGTEATYNPPDWYLEGGAAGGVGPPISFRFFAGGGVAGNTVGFDNMSIENLTQPGAETLHRQFSGCDSLAVEWYRSAALIAYDAWLEATVGVDGREAGGGFTPLRAIPNPFTGEVAIRYWAQSVQPARIEIFNVSGQLVRSWTGAPTGAGRQEVVWDGRSDGGRSVPAGIYWIKVILPDEVQSLAVIRLP